MTVERSVQILNKNGLHARPAAEIVKLTSKYQAEVTLMRIASDFREAAWGVIQQAISVIDTGSLSAAQEAR